MSDLQAIADRVEIEALRGEFTDAAMMRDYDRAASLFTPDGALRAVASVKEVTDDDDSELDTHAHQTGAAGGLAGAMAGPGTLLWMSSRCGCGDVWVGVGECGEDLAGDGALAAADDLLAGLALGQPPAHGVLGGLVVAQPGQRDAVQRGVGVAVAAAAEPVAAGLAGRRRDGATPHSAANAASECSRTGLPPAAASSAPATSTPTPNRPSSRGAAARGQPRQLAVEGGELVGHGLVAAAQMAQREHRRRQPGWTAGRAPGRQRPRPAGRRAGRAAARGR
jgi:hypothetical protein